MGRFWITPLVDDTRRLVCPYKMRGGHETQPPLCRSAFLVPPELTELGKVYHVHHGVPMGMAKRSVASHCVLIACNMTRFCSVGVGRRCDVGVDDSRGRGRRR
jgi:hypothetical protein